MRNAFWVGLAALLCANCSAPAGPAQSSEPATASATQLVQPPRAEASSSGRNADQADERQGDFDYYVLSLSWSPSYCIEAGERADPRQCNAKRPYDFVVHGLWPQLEHGRVDECAGATPLKADIVSSMLEIMPSASLIRHEWRAHGQCSGMNARDYFAAVREARAAVQIPEAFEAPARDRVTDPQWVERAFISANPGLKPEGVAVTCSGRRLREVRVCLTRSFDFRTCSSVDRRACAREQIVAPASRGG